MEELKTCIRKYTEVDDKIRQKNAEVHEMRLVRTTIESELTQIIKKPEFATVEKINLPDGYIRIAKESTKPWSLSKKELQSYLQTYFQLKIPNCEDCFKYIVDSHSNKQASSEISITRIIRS